MSRGLLLILAMTTGCLPSLLEERSLESAHTGAASDDDDAGDDDDDTVGDDDDTTGDDDDTTGDDDDDTVTHCGNAEWDDFDKDGLDDEDEAHFGTDPYQFSCNAYQYGTYNYTTTYTNYTNYYTTYTTTGCYNYGTYIGGAGYWIDLGDLDELLNYLDPLCIDDNPYYSYGTRRYRYPQYDQDGDTFVTPRDCNDGSDYVNPRGSDSCNQTDANCDGVTASCCFKDEDPDGDGLCTPEELAFGSDPMVADADGDQLNDLAERRWGTDPRRVDTDCDGFTDYTETLFAEYLNYALDPLVKNPF